jgi:hypothetical protein
MRKVFVVALSLASIGTFTHFAFAEPIDCAQDYSNCMGASFNGGNTPNSVTFSNGRGMRICSGEKLACVKRNAREGYDPFGRPFTPSLLQVPGNAGGRGGSRPVGGTLRTDGDNAGTLMVTPDGRKWVWNGKTVTVAVVSKPGYTQTITVMQGDPAITMRATVNGVSYNVADPKYAAALAAEQQKAAAAASRAQQSAKRQTQTLINNAQSPTGILPKPKHQAN